MRTLRETGAPKEIVISAQSISKNKKIILREFER